MQNNPDLNLIYAYYYFNGRKIYFEDELKHIEEIDTIENECSEFSYGETLIDEDDFEESIPNYQEKIITTSSRRADAVVSEIFNLSRAKIQEYILKERLYVDFELFTTNSREIKDGSLVSLKGYGRAIFDEVISETKKGKMRARVKKVL